MNLGRVPGPAEARLVHDFTRHIDLIVGVAYHRTLHTLLTAELLLVLNHGSRIRRCLKVTTRSEHTRGQCGCQSIMHRQVSR
jgi:hypothetical protein